MGRLVWPLNSGIEARIAYLEQPPTVGEIWADLGARAMEFIDASRQLDRVVIPESTLRIFKEVSRGDQGVLVATLHLGHWELMAAKLSQVGHPFQAIAARSQSGPVYDALDTHRRTLGIHTLSPGSGGRDAVHALRQGGTVSIFVDQNTGERGRLIPFFGVPAPTPITFERLLAITGATPMLLWNYRSSSGEYVIRAEHGSHLTDMTTLTQRIEALVSQYPAQWVWLHRRWTER